MTTNSHKSSAGAALLKLLLVTGIEGSAVYLWLRIDESGLLWLAILILAVGEITETFLLSTGITRKAGERWGPLERPATDGGYFRRVKLITELAGVAEIGIWLLWLAIAKEYEWYVGAGVLLVLMHLKHHIETAAIRHMPFRSKLLAPDGAFASAMEVAGAVGCLELIRHNHPMLAAIALGGGLLIEHTIHIGVLTWEIKARDIRLPIDPRWKRPRKGQVLVRHVFTHYPRFWRLVQRIKPLERGVNRFIIKALIAAVEPRPNPFSTMAPYTSWASLTDRKYSGRHLPPVVAGATRPATTPTGPPSVEATARLFRRDRAMRECPKKSTVLFGFFAQWLTDGFLRTERNVKRGVLRNTLRNESTHDIDLCQLYGLKRAATRQLRVGRGGLLKYQMINDEEYPPYYCRGGKRKKEFDKLLKPVGFDDLSSELKNQLFASATDVTNVGVVAFNTLFLREHNRIARRLSSENQFWDDDRVFETARNILTVVLLRIVLEEYVNHITPNLFEVRLDASAFPNEPWYRPNWMAIEFNLLYRWHSLVPSTFHVNGEHLPIEKTLYDTSPLTAAGLGPFMAAASSQAAGQIGLLNTDNLLVTWTEMPSIEQARVARLSSYNDYRRLCGMLPAAQFDDISSDADIQRGLSQLYDSVEDVEFYVGLFAEDTMRNGVLPPLMTVMVALDAFSQALTNPLLAPRIYNDETFSRSGMEIIQETRSIADLVRRNVPRCSEEYFVSFARRE